MRIAFGLLTVGCVAVLTTVFYLIRPARAESAPADVHIALIGASIGQDWHLSQWSQRVAAPGYSAESFAIWQFDKSEAVEEVLLRPSRRFRLSVSYVRSLFAPAPRRPQIVILKECSSYFPSDLVRDQQAMTGWANRLRAAGMQVVLATVVPVTQSRSVQNPGKLQSLTEYNNWVRTYAHEQKLPILDLDAALRTAGPGSYLRDDLTIGDGSHVNASAYAILDRVLLKTVCSLRSAAGCGQVGASKEQASTS